MGNEAKKVPHVQEIKA